MDGATMLEVQQTAETYECPLCNLEFEGANCHSSCPLATGCRMVRCPRCGYEFVNDGLLTGLFRRFIGGRRKK